MDEKNELDRLSKLRKEKLQVKTGYEFSTWKNGLSQTQLEKILKNKKGPEEQWLRYYWEKHIKCSAMIPSNTAIQQVKQS